MAVKDVSTKISAFMQKIVAKNPGETEFHQAVHEVAHSLMPFLEENPKYQEAKILERIAEPERVIMFRAPGWMTKGKSRSIEDIAFR